MKPQNALGLALAFALVACGPSNNNRDAGSGGDGATADASLFGTECTTDSECPNGGYCVEGFGAHVCTFECTAGCPQNWECRSTPVHGNPVSVCVPPAFELCTPCSANAQCGAGVCVTLGGEGFCLPQCPFEGSCPQGYSCGPDPTGKNEGQFCVPQTKACTCTSGAQQGQLRTCSQMNSFGTCRGLETCDPNAGGWTGCTAAAATMEQCDGVDNDCNGLVDDGTSGQACMNTVAGVGSCPGVSICTGVGGVICQGKMPATETCNNVDDDCDLMTDEGYPNLNTMCSAGVGGCQRVGLVRCNAAGNGTECSVVAGAPQSELCNNVDDNCNGTVDETFPTKGQGCTVGVGACIRQGNQVCAMSGTSTTCSVTPGAPGTETCNTVDDDCDSRVDEDFKDASGNYTRDRACGSCAVDCTAIYGLPNAFGTCAAGPQCVMNCMPGAFNLDGATANGCEFLLDPSGAVYVSVDDPGSVDDATCGLGPVGTGTGRHPCRTIAQGTARAQALGYTRVLVANGIYVEGVTVANGISLLGGHRPDNWVRDIAATGTVLSGVTSLGVHDATVNASNITMTTIVEGFAIYGSVNTKPRGNSYAIYISNSSASLTIRSNVILGGRGGPGASGASGVDGVAGGDGGGRANTGGTDSNYDAKTVFGASACDAASNRVHSNGGASVCGGDDVSGGNGGGNRCPASPQALCTGCVCTSAANCGCASCNFVSATSSDGIPGQPANGPGGGAAGGAGTKGEDQINKALALASICFIPPGVINGTDGFDGTNGAHGATVGGCTVTAGAVVSGHWSGVTAATGLAGSNGGGGGGGGAGGGSHCDGCDSGFDNFGGHGGGGGGGGCGGAPGGGASAGGGAFDIFITGGTAPTVARNTFVRGEGGVGGAGGAAGRGGVGGSGGAGGTGGVPPLFCARVAGHGGRGGNGGQGSGGAGGCGGSSYGIYTSGVGTPNYCMAASMNAYSGGTGGGGGPGGFSVVNPGGAGVAGALLDCSFN